MFQVYLGELNRIELESEARKKSDFFFYGVRHDTKDQTYEIKIYEGNLEVDEDFEFRFIIPVDGE